MIKLAIEYIATELLALWKVYVSYLLLLISSFSVSMAQPHSISQQSVEILLSRGEFFLESFQVDSLEQAASSALLKSQAIDFEEGIVESLLLLVKAAHAVQDYDLAMGYLIRADSIARGHRMKKNLPLVALELGNTYYYLQQFENALHQYQRAFELSEESDLAVTFQSLTGQANILNNIGSLRETGPVLRHALSIAQVMDDPEKQVEVLNQLATIYFSVGELDSSGKFFEALLAVKSRLGDKNGLISDLNQYGHMFLKQGIYDRAQQYLFEALGMAEELKDSLLMVSIITNIGESFIYQENWEKAREYASLGVNMSAKKGVKQMEAVNWKNVGLARQLLGDVEGALAGYRKALDIYQHSIIDQAEIVTLQMRLAEILEEKADYQEAIYYLDRVLKAKERYSDKLSMLDIQLIMSRLYLRMRDYPNAIRLLQNTEKISSQLHSNIGKSNTYQLMSEAYAQMNDFRQAYLFQQKYVSYRDSLFNEERETIIYESEQRFLKEKKIRENAELEAKVAVKQYEIEKKTRQNYMLNGGIGLLSLVILLLGYVFFKRRQLLRQKLITLEKAYEAENLRSFIGGEQRERQRIARELHDGLGALLASIKLIFNAVENDLPKVAQNGYFKRANHLLNHACQEVREISHNMMPGILDQYGLEQAIKDLCDAINPSNDIDIVFLSFGMDLILEDKVNISVYRIVQELLSNILRHSNASEVIIQINIDDGILRLTVEDNGKGFESNPLPVGQGIGIKNIKSRVVYLLGKMEIDSSPGQGCNVYIEIPIGSHQN